MQPARRPLASALILLVQLYRNSLAYCKLPSCKMRPTCSRYACEALSRYGALRGTWLVVRRLFRCAPWSGTLYDPLT